MAAKNHPFGADVHSSEGFSERLRGLLDSARAPAPRSAGSPASSGSSPRTSSALPLPPALFTNSLASSCHEAHTPRGEAGRAGPVWLPVGRSAAAPPPNPRPASAAACPGGLAQGARRRHDAGARRRCRDPGRRGRRRHLLARERARFSPRAGGSRSARGGRVGALPRSARRR
jgi:hypothetical protein